MRACLIVLLLLAAQAIMTFAMLRVGSAYDVNGDATLNLPTSSALDQADLERAAAVYRFVP